MKKYKKGDWVYNKEGFCLGKFSAYANKDSCLIKTGNHSWITSKLSELK